jgi:hypothetical protein
MEEQLKNFLLADVNLNSLIGTKVNWNTRPQDDVVPGIVLTKVSKSTDYHMAGPSGLANARIQIDCWADTFASVMSIARAVRDALSGASFSQNDVDIQGAFLDNERHFFEDEDAERFHRVSLDFIIWHSENGVTT